MSIILWHIMCIEYFNDNKGIYIRHNVRQNTKFPNLTVITQKIHPEMNVKNATIIFNPNWRNKSRLTEYNGSLASINAFSSLQA